jgi:very-short-patch-repair endonuclease
VLDFYCPQLRLSIELDGGQHNDARHAARDITRGAWLAEQGVTVLRFWNVDIVQNLAGVLETVASTVAQLKSSNVTPTRRWRADLPLSGGGNEPKGRS